ncbi:hypothetical protein BDQ17DRAFT_1367739 [Cyathus striatus]|nr:hypothetical protein BDQ17DRAFT_1367739 [Cyathus striatus]
MVRVEFLCMRDDEQKYLSRLDKNSKISLSDYWKIGIQGLNKDCCELREKIVFRFATLKLQKVNQ